MVTEILKQVAAVSSEAPAQKEPIHVIEYSNLTTDDEIIVTFEGDITAALRFSHTMYQYTGDEELVVITELT